MSVSAEPQHAGLTWGAFIELPEVLLRHAELHDGDVVSSSMLPGFEVAVADVISRAA